MADSLLQHYVKLTEFLGHALGPDYEVALHDLTDKNRSIIAIANSHVSGREIGAPLNDVALKILMDKTYEISDYCLHYRGVSVNGRALRSSTLFIKQNGKMVGMLCINFDDSRYKVVSESILSLCHPDAFVETNFKIDTARVRESLPAPAESSGFAGSIDGVTADAVTKALHSEGVAADRLTQEERLRVIAQLEESGVFLLKGAVKDVAAELGCSPASVYRYLSQLKKDG